MSIPAGFTPNHQGWYYHDDGTGPYYIDADGNACQWAPKKLLTDGDGPYARLRVDVGQTGFFAGREFMAFHEVSVPVGQSLAIRAVNTVDIFLQEFSLDCWEGAIRLELRVGCTVTSPFVNDIPVRRTNQTTGPDYSYDTHVDMDNGGVVTGGTVLDVMRISSGNKDATVTMGGDDTIGMAPNSYHMVLTNVGNQTATGVFKARWEERP